MGVLVPGAVLGPTPRDAAKLRRVNSPRLKANGARRSKTVSLSQLSREVRQCFVVSSIRLS